MSRKVSLRELQDIVGHLKFSCRVIALGCVFLHRLCDAMKALCHPFHRMRVTKGMRQDLQVWSQSLAEFNGVSFRKTEMNLKVEFQVQTDVAGSLGFGIYFNGRWCSELWPEEWHQQEITSRKSYFWNFF